MYVKRLDVDSIDYQLSSSERVDTKEYELYALENGLKVVAVTTKTSLPYAVTRSAITLDV